MKAYTDIEQSKKLAKILPLESADMYYAYGARTPDIMIGSKQDYRCYTVCWSLATLLSVLPRETRLLKSATDDIYYHCDCPKGNVDKWFDNPVDACYELIVKLNELNLL